jgi:tetratricopeptide (TPR) repeat protein
MSKAHQRSGNKTQRNKKLVGQQTKDLTGQSAPKIWLLMGVIVVACAVVLTAHWPALSTQAMSFDDGQYLAENQLVQNPSWTSARRFLTEVLEPSTVGLLFGLHPMTVEPIPWVGERKTLLAAFFALWCLILYIRFTRNSGWKLYIGCMVMYVLALMSKPTSTPLPVLMLLMDFWPLGRLKWRTVLEKLPFFTVGGVFAVITYISQSRTAIVVTPGEYGPQYILPILCHNIIFYLYKIVWPVNLSSHYAYPQPLGLSNPMVLVGVIGTCVLIPLLVISLHWTRAILTGWLFFFVAIFPTMGVVGFTNVIASDKFAYLPSTGLLMVLASFLGWLCNSVNKLTTRRIAVIITVLALAGAEAVATRRNLVHWRDTVSLNEYMLTLTPDAAPVHYNLGFALQLQDMLDQAISHYNKALLIDPNYVEAHNNLGIALLEQNKHSEAINHFRQVLRIRPGYAKAYNNLAWVLATCPDSKLRDAPRAVELAEHAVKLARYQDAAILDTLAAAYAAAGRFDMAVTTAQTAIALASAAENNKLAAQIRERLQLYRQAKPYREPPRAPAGGSKSSPLTSDGLN